MRDLIFPVTMKFNQFWNRDFFLDTINNFDLNKNNSTSPLNKNTLSFTVQFPRELDGTSNIEASLLCHIKMMMGSLCFLTACMLQCIFRWQSSFLCRPHLSLCRSVYTLPGLASTMHGTAIHWLTHSADTC